MHTGWRSLQQNLLVFGEACYPDRQVQKCYGAKGAKITVLLISLVALPYLGSLHNIKKGFIEGLAVWGELLSHIV
jgi:hypothetical protein